MTSKTASRGVRRLLAAAIVVAATMAGRAPRPLDDDGRIVRATLAMLASERAATASPLCIDDRTRGEPLAIFRTMRGKAIGHDLRWRHPAPLHAAPTVSNRALFEDAIGRDRLRIEEPQSTGAALPAAAQRRLDTAATRLAMVGGSTAVTFGAAAAVPGAIPRWWLWNRVRSECARTYVLSRIVRDANTAFVTVTADHWGTTYAVERSGADWRVGAQWDNWLY